MGSKPRATGDENGHAPRAGDLLETVETGTYAEQLDALARELVAAMEKSPPGAKAQTAAQLRAVLKERASLPDAKKVTKADELASRRKARLAAADQRSSAAGEGS